MPRRAHRFPVLLALLAAILGLSECDRLHAQEEPPSFLRSVARALLGGEVAPLLTPADAPVRITRDHLEVQTTNAYDASGVRYFAIHLKVENRTDQVLTLETGTSYLLLGQDRILRVTDPQQVNNTPITLSGGDVEEDDAVEVQVPLQWKIPPKQFPEGWLIYAPLPTSRELPSMQLVLPSSQGEISIDLTQKEADRLKLQTQKIGPRESIAIVRIEGSLNVINLQHLMSTLKQLSQQGATQLILSFGPRAELKDDLIQEWLVDGRDDSDNYRMRFLPSWSGLFQSVIVVGLPGQTDESGDTLSASEAEAIRGVARDLIPRLDAATLRRELREGHSDFRSAILLDHGDLVAQLEPDLIFQTLNDPDSAPQMRVAMIRSLRSMADPRALEVLERMVKEGTREVGAEALCSLNLSPLPAARLRAVAFVRDPQVQKRIGLPLILRTVGTEVDDVWLPVLKEAFGNKDPLARDLALQLLLQSGTSDRRAILEQALADASADVRATAYRALLIRRTDEEEAGFVRETNRRFRAGMRDAETLTGIGELRDPSYVPALLKNIDAGDADEYLVQVYLNLGGNEALTQLVQRYPKLPENSRYRVLKLAHDRGLQVGKLAASLLASPDDELRSLCCLILLTQEDDKSLNAIRTVVISNSDNPIGEGLVRLLGMNSTPRSLQLLNSLAQEPDSQIQRLGLLGLQAHQASRPSFNWREVANDLSSQGQVEGSLEALKLSLEADDQDWFTHNSLGFQYLQLSRHAEARPCFDKARAINPRDHQSLTGIAICLSVEGKASEALRMVDNADALQQFGDQQIYLYNVACVYGRSIEFLRKQSTSVENELCCRAWEQRALHLLRNSIDRGFADPVLMDKDPDLKPLNQLQEFQALLVRLRRVQMER